MADRGHGPEDDTRSRKNSQIKPKAESKVRKELRFSDCGGRQKSVTLFREAVVFF